MFESLNPKPLPQLNVHLPTSTLRQKVTRINVTNRTHSLLMTVWCVAGAVECPHTLTHITEMPSTTVSRSSHWHSEMIVQSCAGLHTSVPCCVFSVLPLLGVMCHDQRHWQQWQLASGRHHIELAISSVLTAFISTRFKVKLSHVGACMTATLSSSHTSSLVRLRCPTRVAACRSLRSRLP